MQICGGGELLQICGAGELLQICGGEWTADGLASLPSGRLWQLLPGRQLNGVRVCEQLQLQS